MGLQTPHFLQAQCKLSQLSRRHGQLIQDFGRTGVINYLERVFMMASLYKAGFMALYQPE
jgi:hypothetical protein